MLAIGLALEELRLGDELGAGVHLADPRRGHGRGARARAAGARPRTAAPPAYQSVLLVTGLLLLYAALLRLADVLGADFGRRGRRLATRRSGGAAARRDDVDVARAGGRRRLGRRGRGAPRPRC